MTTQNKFDSQVRRAPENVQSRYASQASEGVVNPIVLAEIMGVRAQYIYNLIRKGKLEAVKHNNTQKLVIELETAKAFALNYQEGKDARIAARAAKAKALDEAVAAASE